MIIATISRKGGVGKTTTTVNLAAALAERGKRILLIDLDPQASSSRSLGVQRADLAPSIADVLLRNQPAASMVRATAVENLDLITASADLNDAEYTLSSSRQPENVLRHALEGIKSEYETILIDCPPSLSLLARNAIVASDAHLIPAVPHFLALEGIENLIPAIARIGRRNNSSSELLGILLTVVDYRANLTRENVQSIRDHLKEAIMAIEIRTNIRLAEAPQYGQTIFEHAPKSTGAECYRLLAEEFLMRVNQLAARRSIVEQPHQAPTARWERAAQQKAAQATGSKSTPDGETETVREQPNPLMPTRGDNASDGDSTELDALNAWLNSSLSTH